MEKKEWDVEAHMPQYETRDGLAKQLQGGFPMPTMQDVFAEVEFLEDSGALLNLEIAPLRPRAGSQRYR